MTSAILLKHLKNLHLNGMAHALEIQVNQPSTYQDLSFYERLELLLNSETTDRDNRKVERLLKQAKLKLNGTLADIDYSKNRGLQRDVISPLLSLEWIRQHHNVMIEGSTGTGKTYLACALGRHCCEHGISVRYFRTARLLGELALARGDGSFRKCLVQLAKTELIILDDWGLEGLTSSQRTDLLEVMDDRHGTASTIITSQLPISHWHEVIGDPTLADAILDRLLHNAYKFKLKGESLRKRKALVDPA